MKFHLKQYFPPILVNIYRKILISKQKPADNFKEELLGWSGNYSTWQQAIEHSTGYDDNDILEKCKSALLKVKNGEYAYERDSVLFEKIEYSWPVLAAFQRCALENNNQLKVLDFGGSLGSTYFQNKNFLSGIENISWHIVEQEDFVKTGRQYFEDEILKFFLTIEESIRTKPSDILILSSVLQYLPEPYEWIKRFLAFGFRYILIDRTGFDRSRKAGSLTVQHVPEEIYKASYPCWFFNEEKFINAFTSAYTVLTDFKDTITPNVQGDDFLYYWKGFLLKKNDN